MTIFKAKMSTIRSAIRLVGPNAKTLVEIVNAIPLARKDASANLASSETTMASAFQEANV